jgi:hypothetical protein
MQFQQSSEAYSEASSEAIAQGIPRKLLVNDGVSTLNSMNRSMTHGSGPAGRQAAAQLLQALEREITGNQRGSASLLCLGILF